MSFGPIIAATIATADMALATRVYRAGMGLEVFASGTIDAAIAAAWGAPDLAGARWLGLGSGGDDYGALRLVEVPDLPADPLPLASLGWAATEISVIDVDARAAAMAAAGFEMLSAPLPLGSNPLIKAAQFAGPSREGIYVTDLRSYEGVFDVRRATRPVDRCFIAVLAAGDLEAARAFYETTYGTERKTDRPVVVPALTRQLRLAEGEQIRISSQQIDEGCLIEIDAYPEGTPTRPTASGLPAGVSMMSFSGPATGPAGPDDWPYRGRPVDIRRGGAGELIEVIGAAT